MVSCSDGCRLWTTAGGQGRPAVFCHGGPGLWDTLGPVADLLPVRAHRWDQRGCGRSERRGPYSVARFVADLDAVRQHSGADRVTVLGHSWGATLALRYALAHPDRVAALIYVSGTGIDRDATWKPDYERNLRERLGPLRSRWEQLRPAARTDPVSREFAVLQWSADFTDPRTDLDHAERMATPWFGVNAECNATINAEVRGYFDTTDVAAQCRDLPVPTLIVDGTADIRPRRSVDSLERALPHVTRVVLDGAGHLPWVEDPTGFAAGVTAFMRALRS